VSSTFTRQGDTLSRLIEQVIKGEPFIIAKHGKLVAKVTAIASAAGRRRFGFMAGEIKVPDDFDRI
jgi:antitoxin (DNA-binding transcriptional repressor) of toxin-antitoxin stability system